MGRTTVLAAFRASLAALSTTLETTAAHYVRCIKPNTAQAAGEFDGACVCAPRVSPAPPGRPALWRPGQSRRGGGGASLPLYLAGGGALGTFSEPSRNSALAGEYVARQLACTGVLSVIDVSKVGFPVSMPKLHFLNSYRCIAPAAAASAGSVPPEGGELDAACTLLLRGAAALLGETARWAEEVVFPSDGPRLPQTCPRHVQHTSHRGRR